MGEKPLEVQPLWNLNSVCLRVVCDDDTFVHALRLLCALLGLVIPKYANENSSVVAGAKGSARRCAANTGSIIIIIKVCVRTVVEAR
jgi:hypothetical protein